MQPQVSLPLSDVDWPRSWARAGGNFGQMHANLKGSEPQSCVAAVAECEAVLKDLEDALLATWDLETGEAAVGQIRRGPGPSTCKGADRAPAPLFFALDMDCQAMARSDFASNSVFGALCGIYGQHRMNGLLWVPEGRSYSFGEDVELPRRLRGLRYAS
jgi:hypothetical protein